LKWENWRAQSSKKLFDFKGFLMAALSV